MKGSNSGNGNTQPMDLRLLGELPLVYIRALEWFDLLQVINQAQVAHGNGDFLELAMGSQRRKLIKTLNTGNGNTQPMDLKLLGEVPLV